ncbi:hypothetical protein ACGFLS_04675 [Streptomyces abikoensis]
MPVPHRHGLASGGAPSSVTDDRFCTFRASPTMAGTASSVD